MEGTFSKFTQAVTSKLPLSMGPLHDPVTWYKITHAGEQVAQWDFQNKRRSRWTDTIQRSHCATCSPACVILYHVTGSYKGPIIQDSLFSAYKQSATHLARVVQRLDKAIHRISHYPVDSVVCFVNIYPLDSDLSCG